MYRPPEAGRLEEKTMSVQTETQAGLQQALGRSAKPSVFASIARFARTKRMGFVGAVIVVIVAFAAVFGPVLAPYDPHSLQLSNRLSAPSLTHVFGTDEKGRDIFTRILYGARAASIVGFGAVAVSLVMKLSVGLTSAFKGGKTDLILQRVVDAQMSIPTLTILMAAVLVLGQGYLTLIILLGFFSGIRGSRVIRGAALSIQQNDYITAAQALGASDVRIILQHIMPNIFAPIMVVATVNLAATILTEASLSFLNLGLTFPAVSWGSMLALAGLPYMMEAPWMVLFPGLAITSVVWGINILGDALRDVLDPRLRRGV